VIVPTEAVIATGKRSVVIVAEGDGKFTPVDVEPGAESEGDTEIRRGLQAGQKVVTSGQFLIDSEASLRGTARRMGSAKAAPDPAQATYRSSGKVEAIGGTDITLSHEAIPQLRWNAMTMTFVLSDPRLATGIGIGQRVTFEFRGKGEGVYEIVSIAPAGASAPAPGAAAAHAHGAGAPGARP
jgi:Cu(I)/Ag(I) efflux system membrane fusion protein